MTATITPDRWQAARTALQETADRFLHLAGAVDRPQTLVTAEWSVADTLAHVVSLSSLYLHLLDPTHPLPSVPGLHDDLPAATVDTVADLNDLVLRHLTERDPQVLLDRLRADVGQLLVAGDGRPPTDTVPWLGGARVPVAGLFAHLVNELLIHGRDIARATGRPWTIPGRDAVLFLELFLVGVARNGYGRLLDGPRPPAYPITVRFRSAYSPDVTLLLSAGRVTLAAPDVRPDVRIRFDPATLNLLMFGRVTRARAVLSGKVRISGRRPWRLLPFLRVFRTPS